MNKKRVGTYTANIYIGTTVGYDGETQSVDVVRKICQDYCDRFGAGVTVTETEFIYVDGNEKGAIVGFIKYPRFPLPEHEIKDQALHLAKKLMIKLQQFRCSIVCTDETIMLTNEELEEL
jgi:hypothetical protein